MHLPKIVAVKAAPKIDKNTPNIASPIVSGEKNSPCEAQLIMYQKWQYRRKVLSPNLKIKIYIPQRGEKILQTEHLKTKFSK